MRLNLGSGHSLFPGYTNVDRHPLPTVDVVTDLDLVDWPWNDGSVERIEANNIFEHVHDPINFITECHRILQPGGHLHIRTPDISSPDSWTDPTHVRHCTPDSFSFWIADGNPHYVASNAQYGGVAFTLTDLHMDRGQIDITLAKEPKQAATVYCDDRASYGQMPVFCSQAAGHQGDHESADFRWQAGSMMASLKHPGPAAA